MERTPGREARARAARGALEGLIRSAEHLAGEAQRRAPKDEGTLRGSVAVVLIVNGTRYEGAGAKAQARRAVTEAALNGSPIRMDAEVSFNTVYAARQHEELGWHHDEGEAKYLERPLGENANRYQRIIAASAERGAA
jgi:hypothetical protein